MPRSESHYGTDANRRRADDKWTECAVTFPSSHGNLLTFRNRRLALIRDGLGAVSMAAGPIFVCHVIPLASLLPGHTEPASLDVAADELEWARPGDNRLLPRRFFHGDGRVCISEITQDAVRYGYAQLFDDGAIELVGSVWTNLDSPNGQPVLYPGLYEGSLH